jgi:hypothetical protein
VYYAIRTGIRYTGMPAWGKTMNEQDMWKVTAFLTQIEKLPPAVQEFWKNTTVSSLPSDAEKDSTEKGTDSDRKTQPAK